MAPYRVYFLNEGGRIEAGHDFEAESDAVALVVADALCEACADACDRFELWQGVRRVEKLPVRRDTEMLRNATEQVLKAARAISEGGGVLGQSKTLAAAIERLERDIAARG
ncbi:MAG TPA: hypothetical protein VN681_06410 [Stellaceae bacterium]|nr:hypothetical protein [Stellaceae bacterium]